MGQRLNTGRIGAMPADGEIEADGLTEADAEDEGDGETELDGLTLADGDTLGLTDELFPPAAISPVPRKSSAPAPLLYQPIPAAPGVAPETEESVVVEPSTPSLFGVSVLVDPFHVTESLRVPLTTPADGEAIAVNAPLTHF